jgi:hypothetical protein
MAAPSRFRSNPVNSMNTPLFARFLSFTVGLTLVVGAVLIFGTEPFLRILEAENTAATRLLARMLGGCIIGMSLVYASMRGCTDPAQWRKLLAGGTVQDGVMTAMFVPAILQGVVGPAGWAIAMALAGVTIAHLVLLAILRGTGNRLNRKQSDQSDGQIARVSVTR